MKFLLSVLAMGTVGGIVSPLMVVDRGQGIFKGSRVFRERRGDELPSLSDGERRNFFFGKPDTSEQGIDEP